MSNILLSCRVIEDPSTPSIFSIRSLKGDILLKDFVVSGVKISDHEVIVCSFEKGIIALYNITAKSLMTIVSDETRYSYPMAYLPDYCAFIYSSSKREEDNYVMDVKFVAMNIRTGTILFEYIRPESFIGRFSNSYTRSDGVSFMVESSEYLHLYRVDFVNKNIKDLDLFQFRGILAYDKEKDIIIVYSQTSIEQYSFKEKKFRRVNDVKIEGSSDILDIEVISKDELFFIGDSRVGILNLHDGKIIKELNIPHEYTILVSIYKKNIFLLDWPEKKTLYRTDLDLQYLEKVATFQEVSIESMNILEYTPDKMNKIRTCNTLTDAIFV